MLIKNLPLMPSKPSKNLPERLPAPCTIDFQSKKSIPRPKRLSKPSKNLPARLPEPSKIDFHSKKLLPQGFSKAYSIQVAILCPVSMDFPSQTVSEMTENQAKILGHPILGQAKNNLQPPSSYLVLSPSNHLIISSYYLVLLSSRQRIIPSSRHLITSSSHHVIISSSHHTVNRTCLKGSLIVLALRGSQGICSQGTCSQGTAHGSLKNGLIQHDYESVFTYSRYYTRALPILGQPRKAH